LQVKKMKYRSMIALETLESRTLYSATPSSTILADEAAVTAAKAQKATDQSAGTQTLLADQLQLLQDRSTKSSALAPLLLQLQSDTAAENQAILTDHENDLTTRIADRTAITNDLRHMAADDDNSEDEHDDRLQWAADKSKLKNDIADDDITLNNTKSSFRTTILSDRLAILEARTTDSPAVDIDKTKILDDKASEKNTLLADQEAIVSTELKLAEDRAAGL
jgi:hypothetical protein